MGIQAQIVPINPNPQIFFIFRERVPFSQGSNPGFRGPVRIITPNECPPARAIHDLRRGNFPLDSPLPLKCIGPERLPSRRVLQNATHPESNLRVYSQNATSPRRGVRVYVFRGDGHRDANKSIPTGDPDARLRLVLDRHAPLPSGSPDARTRPRRGARAPAGLRAELCRSSDGAGPVSGTPAPALRDGHGSGWRDRRPGRRSHHPSRRPAGRGLCRWRGAGRIWLLCRRTLPADPRRHAV